MSAEEFDNTLEHNFIKCFASVHLVEMLLGCPSVDIRGRTIKTSTSIYHKCYSFVCFIATTFSCFHILKFLYKAYSRDITFYTTYSLIVILLYNTYFSNTIHATFCEDRRRSVKLYFILQKIDRTLGLKRCKSLLIFQYYTNTFLLVCLVGLSIFSIMTYYLNVSDYPWCAVIYSVAFCSAQVSLFRCWSSIVFITLRMRFLNKIIRFNMVFKIDKNAKFPKPTTRFYKFVSRQWFARDMLLGPNFFNNPMDVRKIAVCQIDILKAYGIVIEQFGFIMFITVCTLFVYTFLAIELVFLGSRNGLMSYVASVVALVAILIYLLLLSYLAGLNAWFTSETKSSRKSCVRVLSQVYEGPIYEAAKVMLGALNTNQNEFTVYGIFTVNGSFPLKLYSLIISQVLVMIQLTM